MEQLYRKFESALEASSTWNTLSEEEQKRFKHWLIITSYRMSDLLSQEAVDEIFNISDNLNNLLLLFYNFFIAGKGCESAFKDIPAWSSCDEKENISRYIVFEVINVTKYYKYDKYLDILDEITGQEFKRLVAYNVRQETVLDGYEIQFIINDEKMTR